MNLKEAVIRARKGDRAAINALYHAHKEQVYFLCLKLTQNKDAACDMLQYSFLHAFHKLGLLRDPEDFQAWLLAVAANRCKNFLREQKPDLFSDTLPDKEPKIKYTLTDVTPTPKVAASEEARNYVLGLIDTMPDAFRFAIMNCYFAGMSEAQSAKLLECSENVMKSYLAQAEKIINDGCDDACGEIPALREYSTAELSAILLRAAELVHVPEFIAEAVGAAAMTLISNNGVRTVQDAVRSQSSGKAGKAAAEGPRRGGSRPVMIFIAVLLIAAIGIGAWLILRPKNPGEEQNSDSLSGEVSQNTGDSDSTSTEPTDSKDSESASGGESTADTNDVSSGENTEPDTTDVESDTPDTSDTTAPVTEDATDTLPPTEEGTTFTCSVRGENMVITGYTGTASRVVIPSEIDGKPVTAIASSAFRENATVTSVYLPDSVTEIGDSAFYGCPNLTAVYLGKAAKIGSYAFYNCFKLSEVELDRVTSVGSSAFYGTPWMSAQQEAAAYVVIGDGVLLKYVGRDSEAVIPSGVKSMTNAFYFDNRVTSVVLPDTMERIGIFAFCSCTQLRSITIPESVTEIDAQAIYQCAALTEIHVKRGSYADQWLTEYGYDALAVYDETAES